LSGLTDRHGPSGFLRAFAGRTSAAGAVTSRAHGSTLELVLPNNGRSPLRFHPADRVEWPASDGWYDVTVSSGTDLTYRFAGKIERGR
jgi:hypothetical protein